MTLFSKFLLASALTAVTTAGTHAAPTDQSVPTPVTVERSATASGTFQVAAARKYFVILGSFKRRSAANRRCSMFGDGYVINTRDYPNFRNGYWSCVIGPLYKYEAEDQMWASKEAVPDAYVKAGW